MRCHAWSTSARPPSLRWHHGDKAYIRSVFVIVRVQDLALLALREIAQRDFRAEDRDMKAANRSSPAQARVLVKKYPDQAFVEERAGEGRARDRMAAARALHAQGNKAGVERLLADWPGIATEPMEGPPGIPSFGDQPVHGLVDLLFELEPIDAIRRMRETLEETAPAIKYEIMNEVDTALGYNTFFTPDQSPDRPQPAKVHRTVEAAAKKLAYIWSDRYHFDPKARQRECLAQRYDIVNTWRKAGEGDEREIAEDAHRRTDPSRREHHPGDPLVRGCPRAQ